jgi:hypothetical protein
MDVEREKLRMKEASNEIASLSSLFDLGSEEMPIEEYVQLAGEDTVDATWLSWWI